MNACIIEGRYPIATVQHAEKNRNEVKLSSQNPQRTIKHLISNPVMV